MQEWINLTTVTGVLFWLLILAGSSFAGFSRCYEDSTSLEATMPIRGIAALGVIFHHISQNGDFQKLHLMSPFVNAGFLFVAVFMFFSGYGLIKSLDAKPGYLKGFFSRRLPVILVPYYVSILFCIIWRLIEHASYTPLQWLSYALGVAMINEYAWYPITLLFLYLAFYFCVGKIKNRNLSLILVLLFIVFLGAVFAVNGHFAWWYGKKNWWLSFNPNPKWWTAQKVFWFSGEWWVNSAIAFWVGLFVASKERAVRKFFKRLYWLWLAVLAGLVWAASVLNSFMQGKFGYWTEYSGMGPGICNKFITFLGQLPYVALFALLLYVLLMKVKTSNPVTRFLGKISYETYMMNFLAINIASKSYPALIGKEMYFVLVVALTMILALVYRAVNQGVLKLIKSRR